MATWGQSRVGTIDPSLNHDKNNYYHSFKTWIEIRLKVRPGSRVRLTIYPGQRKDKSGYYHNFQTWLKGQPWARLRSQVKLTIDPSQRDNKNDYYHSLKPNSVVDPRSGSGHMSCWLLIQINAMLTIDSNQCKDKNYYYYYSFKIQLYDRLKAKLGSWTRTINLGRLGDRPCQVDSNSKTNIAASFWPKKYIKKVNRFFTRILFWVDPIF